MSGQAAVQERPAERLSKDELRVIRYIEEDLVESEGPIKDAVGKWAAVTWRQYLVAGCDPAAVVQRLPRLIRLLEDELADLCDMYRGSAQDPDPLEEPATIAQLVAEDLAGAQAAEALLERLRRQPWSGGV